MNPPSDCLRCGACCFSGSDTFVRVTGADWARLGTDAPRLARFNGHRAFMRMEHGHCAALEIRTHPDGAPEYFCTAYERRPQICRDLARGSPECAGERARTAADAAGREKIPDGSPWRAAARPLQATTDLPSL